MPVDAVGEGLGKDTREAEAPELLCAPRMNEEPFVEVLVVLIQIVGGHQDRFHRSSLPEIEFVCDARDTIALIRRAVIAASSDLHAPVAELVGFPLAVMRKGARIATLQHTPMRCLIVDDNHSFLEAARVLLEREGLAVAGVASTSDEALRQVETLRPDVVLVDISLGKESGLDLARRLAEGRLRSEPAIVLISTRAEADVADLIAASPAAGFLPKAELSAGAIRRIVDGRVS